MFDDEETLADLSQRSIMFVLSLLRTDLLHTSLNYADMVGEGRRGIII